MTAEAVDLLAIVSRKALAAVVFPVFVTHSPAASALRLTKSTACAVTGNELSSLPGLNRETDRYRCAMKSAQKSSTALPRTGARPSNSESKNSVKSFQKL